jgi:putative ABC transport system permease protein
MRLAFRNLWRHPWRTLATVLGIALGIAAVLATLSVGRNVTANLERSLEIAAGSADLIISPGVAGRAVLEIDEALEAVSERTDIARLTPVLTYQAEPLSEIGVRRDSAVPGVNTGFQLIGKPPERIVAELVSGTLPAADGTIVLAEQFAGQRGLGVGDTITFATPLGDRPFVISGIAADGSGEASRNSGRIGLTSLTTLQDAVRLSGRASFIELELLERQTLNATREALEQLLGDRYTVTLPAGSGDIAAGIVQSLESGLQVLAATLLALAGFMAYNTFAASVGERVREFALLRTIALTRVQVQQLALLEALYLSLAGGVVGIGLGVGLSYLITLANSALLGFTVQTLVLPLEVTALAAAIGLIVSLFAGYLPARVASQTPPIVASRRAENLQPEPRVRLGSLLLVSGVASALSPWQGLWALFGSALSLALLFMGVIFLSPLLLRPVIRVVRPLLKPLLGISARLGADFTLRNAARNGVAVGAVVVGLTLTIGVGGMVSGINQAIADWVATTVIGDLFVTAPVAFPENFAEDALTRVPELESVSGVGVRVVRFEPEGDLPARSVALILVEPERFHPERGFGSFQYLEGSPQAGYDTLAAGQLLAANTVSERFNLAQGSRASLRTRNGFQTFKVGGVVVDFTGGGEAFIASLDSLELFGGGTPDLFVMNLQAGADPEAAREALLNAYPQLYLDISSNAQYRARILTITQQTFVTTNGLLVLAIFIAALGVANTLGMNLTDRQHDIAVLRTLGVTRQGIRQIVTAEGVILVLLGTLLGVAIGVLLSFVITTGANALTGFTVTPRFPLRLIVIALLTSPLIGLVSSLLPARRAARLPPVLALGVSD